MSTIFIADSHLQHDCDENYIAMLRFLSELRGNTSTLFIMGDFFEFWIDYPIAAFPHYLPVLEALKKLHESGTEIIFFEGNHDFHMGAFFTDTLQARVYPGPAEMALAGRRAYLCNGDEINSADIPYRLLRAVFHSRTTHLLTRVVPSCITCAIAERLGRKGRKNIVYKGEKPEHKRTIQGFANRLFNEGYDLVITGHFHLPFIETLPDAPHKMLVSLGDWATRLSYAEIIEGEISLKTFTA